MDDLEKLPTKKKKFTEYQQDYNLSSKSFVHIIGTNVSLFVCMMLPFLLIGFIWTDFGAPQFSFKLVSEGIVTVALLVIGETMMMQIGASGGKLDKDYINTKKSFEDTFNKVGDIGTMLLPMFCAWQVDVEMEQAVGARLRYLHMTKEEWEKVKDLPKKTLLRKYGGKKTHIILELKTIEPVELNESVLLFNNNDPFARGGVPISGEEYIYNKSHSPTLLLSAIFAGLLTVSFAISLTSDISFARVLYTLFKLVILLFRMAKGYEIGAKAYNTVEVKQLTARNYYLKSYTKFVTDKVYLKLGDKYGDASRLMPDDETKEETVATEETTPESPDAVDVSTKEPETNEAHS